MSSTFPPLHSEKPPLRHWNQDIRIVVPDAVHPATDGAPLVGTGTGFTHQLEKSPYRRRRIEPVVEQFGVDDRRLSVVDVGKPWCGRRCDDGEGLQGVAALVPALPQSRE